jgi:3-hydroxyisobutyrate dehydrogenase
MSTESAIKRIAFVGVGTMGRGMVKNLLKAGFEVIIFARNPEKVSEILEAGAVLADSSRAAMEQADLGITMVPNTPEVEEVILGTDGLLEGAKPGSVIVDMSTINPETSRRVSAKCREKNVDFMDAPVSGGSMGAENGTLAIMAGGEAETYERILPVFKAMGREDAIFHIGPVGSGETVKILNNMLAAVSAAMSAEALVMGLKAGVNPEIITVVIGKSSGQNMQLTQVFPRQVFTGAFKPGFFTELMHKDLGLSIELGEATGVAATLAQEARKLYTAALEAGFGRDDYTSVIRPLELASGVVVRTNQK